MRHRGGGTVVFSTSWPGIKSRSRSSSVTLLFTELEASCPEEDEVYQELARVASQQRARPVVHRFRVEVKGQHTGTSDRLKPACSMWRSWDSVRLAGPVLQGLPVYSVKFRPAKAGNYSVSVWQEYAGPDDLGERVGNVCHRLSLLAPIGLEVALSSEKTLSRWGGHGMLDDVFAHLQVVIDHIEIVVNKGFQPPQLTRVVALENIFIYVLPLIRDGLHSKSPT